MRKLKNRLYTVSTLVPFGARVADIGCDHGHLCIYLINEGISPLCIASDIKEKPLNSAKANIEKVGLSIETRLGPGLSTIKENEVDCIVIAGMGGEVISSILDACPWVKNKKYTLLLQPMTSADALRKFLCENGFNIKSETATEEDGRIHTVIKAVFSGKCFSPDDAFLRVGKLFGKDELSVKYINKQLLIIQKLISDLTSAGMDAEAYIQTYNKIKNLLGGNDAD